MYKNGKNYYTSITVDGKRITKSLRTSDKKEARILERKLKREIYPQLVSGNYDDRPNAPDERALIKKFLDIKTPNTKRTYHYILYSVMPKTDKFLNIAEATEHSYKRHINAFYNWCNEHYRCNYQTYKIWEVAGRSRVFNKEELNNILKKTKHIVNYKSKLLKNFRQFVNFAYYTGARRHELITVISKEDGYMWVDGKMGRRMVKLNSQANKYYGTWNYTDDDITKGFKLEVRRLGIRDARFHDLRRTFGLNCLLNGVDIYDLSKLLGHKSVRITEKHYAPLLPVQVKEFKI